MTVTKKQPKDTIKFMEISIHCSNGLPRTTVYDFNSTICNCTILPILVIFDHTNVFLLLFLVLFQHDCKCAYQTIIIIIFISYSSTNSKQPKYRDGW